MKSIFLFTAIAAASAMIAAAEPGAATSEERALVLAAFKASKAEVATVVTPKRGPDSMLPNCYKENFSFTIPSIAPAGGQVFICSKKEYGDSLVAYFRQYQALAGPYIYQSKDGRVVAQLNKGLGFADAEKFESAIKPLELPVAEDRE